MAIPNGFIFNIGGPFVNRNADDIVIPTAKNTGCKRLERSGANSIFTVGPEL